MGVVDSVQWACALCGPCIQNDRVSRAMNLYQILHKAWIFLCRNYLGDSEALAMGNWWLAVSSRQHDHSRIMSHAEIFGETSNHPGDSAPLQPRFGALRLLAFPKTKITFEREEVSDHWWDSEKYNRAADGNWRTVWGPKVPTLKGTEASLSYVQCFLYLVSCSINVFSFHSTWLDTFWTDLIYQQTHC